MKYREKGASIFVSNTKNVDSNNRKHDSYKISCHCGCTKNRNTKEKAIDDAKKNLIKVPLHNGTVPHEQEGRFGGAHVFLKPASHGTGVIAGGAMRSVLESVGVKDVLAKSKGSSNPANVVKATIEALTQMRDANTVARQRGVSLDTVFNG